MLGVGRLLILASSQPRTFRFARTGGRRCRAISFGAASPCAGMLWRSGGTATGLIRSARASRDYLRTRRSARAGGGSSPNLPSQLRSRRSARCIPHSGVVVALLSPGIPAPSRWVGATTRLARPSAGTGLQPASAWIFANWCDWRRARGTAAAILAPLMPAAGTDAEALQRASE